MRGIILAGGLGSRMAPPSLAVNKHLLPVYDKPLIFYPISTLMLAGIRDIAVVTSPQDVETFVRLLGHGEEFGIEISYVVQVEPLGIVDGLRLARRAEENESVALVLGDNIFHGADLGLALGTAFEEPNATVFAVQVADPRRYAVVDFGRSDQVISIEEKPPRPRSNWVVPGLYLLPSDAFRVASRVGLGSRGEYEIVDALQEYLQQGRLRVNKLSRASFWTDAGTPDSLLSAAQYVQAMTQSHGTLISSPEEVAFRQDWITREQLRQRAQKLAGSDYGRRLLSLRR